MARPQQAFENKRTNRWTNARAFVAATLKHKGFWAETVDSLVESAFSCFQVIVSTPASMHTTV